MKTIRKVVVLLLFIVLIALLAILVRIYLDIRDAKAYVNFVTDSANTLIIRVENVNKLLNEFDTDNAESSKELMENELSSINAENNEIKRKRTEEVRKPYKGENLDQSFSEYLGRIEDLSLALTDLTTTMGSDEDSEVFEEKLETYVNESNELQKESDELEQELNNFVDIYNKIDLERVKDAITSI